jgi:thioredoxin reductase (NADPH)
VENYPGFPDGIDGKELLMRIRKQAERFGTKFVSDNIKKIESLKGKIKWKIIGEKEYEAKAVIIASGTKNNKLNVPGEEKYRGKGISYCAECDAALFKNKEVAVIGGGDTAVKEALFISKFCKKVYIIHMRDKLRAEKILQQKALKNKKIEFVLSSVVEEILGDSFVRAVKIRNLKTGKIKNLACQGIFIFVGLMPNTEFLEGIVDLDESGSIIVDENMKTSIAGLFAAGDLRKNSWHQIISACSDGALAAISAQKYIDSLELS